MLDYRLLLLCAVVGMCVFATTLDGRGAEADEPVIGGIPLTTLLERAALSGIPRAPTPGKRNGGQVPDPNAENAVRNLDTNALPYLVHMIEDNSSGRAKMAINAFRLLGPKAGPAIPALEKVGLASGKSETVFGVLQSLHYIGKEALPALERLSTNPVCRVGAVAAIMEIGKERGGIQQVFVEIVKPGDKAAEMAVMALRNYQSSNALPLLTNVLSHPQAGMRETALEVIRQFDAQARPAVPAVIDRLYDPDKSVRDTAVNVLSKVAPEMFVTNSASGRSR
jgi:HEAT repeat protein